MVNWLQSTRVQELIHPLIGMASTKSTVDESTMPVDQVRLMNGFAIMVITLVLLKPVMMNAWPDRSMMHLPS